MKTTRKYFGALMLGLTALSVASCTDTWDEHYNTVDGTVPTESLWELISKNPEMSKFAQLAQKVHYYRDERHPQADYTFKDMLDSKQAMTVWIPKNDAYSDEQWHAWFQQAETAPFTVQQQLLANSVALWRRVVSSPGIDTITMVNAKKYAFDTQQLTMGGRFLSPNAYNIAASNGTLHTVDKFLPFNYNLYEYMKDEMNAANTGITSLSKFVVANDTTYFSPTSSIEGAPDTNGNPTYVDSVYFTSNNLFFANKRFPSRLNTERFLTYNEGFGAYLDAEDSTFVMVVPTDAAWENAVQTLSPFYKYAPVYLDNEKLDENPRYNVLRQSSNVDSLTQKNLVMDIASPLVFNVNLQPDASGRVGTWSVEDFLKNSEKAKHFLNTYGDTLRSDDDWQKSSLLEGQAVEMSNGYAILADKWNFPSKFYKPDVNVELGYRSLYQLDNSTFTSTTVSFSNTAASAWVDSVGRVSNDNFMKFKAPTNSRLSVNFKLRGTQQEIHETEVMSGKYDIYAVLVPAFYETSGSEIFGDTVKAKVTATLSYNDGNANGRAATSKSQQYDYQGEKVDTVLLFQDFVFPYTYKNLIHSYPTLLIEAARPNSKEQALGYRAELYIDRIILKSKD